MKSSSVYWTRQVPGWGPAVPIAYGRKLAKSSAKSWQGGNGYGNGRSGPGNGYRGGGGKGGKKKEKENNNSDKI